MREAIETIASGTSAFCLIQKQDSEEILVLSGETGQYDRLIDIPRKRGPAGDARRYDTISVIPFGQIRERGYEVHDGGEKIRTIEVVRQQTIRVEDLLCRLPEAAIRLEGEIRYENSEEEYGEIIRRIVREEIGEGEGANFVIPRNGAGRLGGFGPAMACAIFSNLVREDYGTYWKFLFYDTDRYFIGSTPERHLLVEGNRVKMNPISGTLRKDIDYECRDHFKSELLSFLRDQKEINELFMVVDEELKMMAAMCSGGGTIVGPLIKEMSRLIHTEYLLSGVSDKDCIDLFRNSMFAATVVGSPVENACRVIKKHTRSSRGYYGSALMLLGRDPNGDDYLDAPITIRTLEIESNGDFRCSAGATLVRDCVAAEEVRETLAKSRAILGALTAYRQRAAGKPRLPALANDDEIVETLNRRNQCLSNFWFFEQDAGGRHYPALAGVAMTLIHNGDDFIYMLRHMLAAMGISATVVDHRSYRYARDRADITLLGPGPGNPNNDSDAKIEKNMAIGRELLGQGQKILAICLGHQVLCRCLGLPVSRKQQPLQGTQVEIDLFGRREKVGFYNTFTATGTAAEPACELAVLPGSREIAAIKSREFIGYQFHPESILTQNGFHILRQAVRHLLREE